MQDNLSSSFWTGVVLYLMLLAVIGCREAVIPQESITWTSEGITVSCIPHCSQTELFELSRTYGHYHYQLRADDGQRQMFQLLQEHDRQEQAFFTRMCGMLLIMGCLVFGVWAIGLWRRHANIPYDGQ